MELPPEAQSISLIGIDYLLLKTKEGGDLYLTHFGLPFWKQLAPENWHDQDWFVGHRIRLEGSSTIYKVSTKPLNGISLELVVRFSRVGQEVPIDASTLNQNPNAEFNGPFEEFALVMKLRTASLVSGPRIFTKKPLAIYVPPERLRDWQTGRSESKLAAKLARHPEVRLDACRQYILLYGWIKGLNAVEAEQALGISEGAAQGFLAQTTLHATRDLEQHGFRMLDIKPQHVVLRIRRDGSLLRHHNGNAAYALVDYELLERLGQFASEPQRRERNN